MPGVIGLRGSGEFNTDFRPTNYRELFTLLEPNGNAPLNAMMAMGSSESTDDPKYNNFRDELPDRTLLLGGSYAGDSSTTSLTLDASSEEGYVLKGSIIVNANTGEVMHATEDGLTTANTLKVIRNIGGTSLGVTAGDELFVAGFAAQEGDVSPSAISFDPTVAYNFTQIFRTPFKVTETLAHTYRRTGDAEDEYSTKALKLHMSDCERAHLFGRRHETAGSSSQPTRYTGGVTTMISNVTDVSTSGGSPDGVAGQITEESFDRMLIEDIFAYGSSEKIMFCGAKVAGHLQAFGKNRWQPTTVEGTYGVNLTRYKTFAGDLMVHLHPQFRQIPSMGSAALILDFPYLKYRFLEGRDTSLLRDRQSNDEDARKHEYLTECGLELLQDKVHTYVKGWTKYK